MIIILSNYPTSHQPMTSAWWWDRKDKQTDGHALLWRWTRTFPLSTYTGRAPETMRERDFRPFSGRQNNKNGYHPAKKFIWKQAWSETPVPLSVLFPFDVKDTLSSFSFSPSLMTPNIGASSAIVKSMISVKGGRVRKGWRLEENLTLIVSLRSFLCLYFLEI